MKRLFVLGFYGQNNFGDDLFCYVIISSLEKYNKVKFVGVTQSLFEENSFFPISVNRIFITQNNLIGKLYRIFLNIVSVIVANKILYGGGSVFGKYASYKQRSLVINLAKLLNKKVYALGVSIGPFDNLEQERKFLKLISNLDAIWVRDKKSENYLSKYNIPYVSHGDMVFALRNKLGSKKTQKNLMIIAVHELAYIDDIVKIINQHLNKKGEVLFISLDPESKRVANNLREKIRDQNLAYIIYSNNLIEIIELFKTAEFVVTSKLHGAIISYVLNIPFYLYEYQDKCTEFLKLINWYEYQEDSKNSYLSGKYNDIYEYTNIIENESELSNFLLRAINEK